MDNVAEWRHLPNNEIGLPISIKPNPIINGSNWFKKDMSKA
jgi:hypothetical protein